MFKSKTLYIYIAVACALILAADTANAYWLWTPESKKFVNPKHTAKDSPVEQFEWAMSFYDTRDYEKAAAEFGKLTKQYEYSEYAAKGQYYVGLCYENMDKPYIAFENYQKAIDNFPNIDNIDEIIARQFNIANLYASKDNPKIFGADIMTSLDRAIDIYRKVVDNAPYGRLADEAQFRMAETMKAAERYDEAILAFQKIVDDYPESEFLDRARYEVAHCGYKASLKPAYDIGPTDKAIRSFEEFMQDHRDEGLVEEADKTIQRLKDRAAQKLLITAEFYENQKRYRSAIIYYQEIVDKYPGSSFVELSKAKVEALNRKVKKK